MQSFKYTKGALYNIFYTNTSVKIVLGIFTLNSLCKDNQSPNIAFLVNISWKTEFNFHVTKHTCIIYVSMEMTHVLYHCNQHDTGTSFHNLNPRPVHESGQPCSLPTRSCE